MMTDHRLCASISTDELIRGESNVRPAQSNRLLPTARLEIRCSSGVASTTSSPSSLRAGFEPFLSCSSSMLSTYREVGNRCPRWWSASVPLKTHENTRTFGKQKKWKNIGKMENWKREEGGKMEKRKNDAKTEETRNESETKLRCHTLSSRRCAFGSFRVAALAPVFILPTSSSTTGWSCRYKMAPSSKNSPTSHQSKQIEFHKRCQGRRTALFVLPTQHKALTGNPDSGRKPHNIQNMATQFLDFTDFAAFLKSWILSFVSQD